MIDIKNLFTEMGGVEITGFGEEALSIPSPESKVISKKGLDSVVWVRQNNLSQELAIIVNLQISSPSIKVLKGFEKTGAIVPFRCEWDDIGLYIEGLDARVEEVGEFKISPDVAEVQFLITVKNFVEIKGL